MTIDLSQVSTQELWDELSKREDWGDIELDPSVSMGYVLSQTFKAWKEKE